MGECRRESIPGRPPRGRPARAERLTFHVSRITFHAPLSLFITSHRFGCEICQSLLRLLRLCYAFCYGSKVSKPLIPLVCYDCYGYLPQGDPPHHLKPLFAASFGPLVLWSVVCGRRPWSAVSGPVVRAARRSAFSFQLSGQFRPFPGGFRSIPAFSGLFRPNFCDGRGVPTRRFLRPPPPCAYHASRITHHASRITHHVSRFPHHT